MIGTVLLLQNLKPNIYRRWFFKSLTIRGWEGEFNYIVALLSFKNFKRNIYHHQFINFDKISLKNGKMLCTRAKVSYFFPRKSLGPTHSLDFGQNCIFFIRKLYFIFSGPNFSILATLFFFSQEKLRIHSLTQINQPEKKNTAPKKKIHHFHSLTRFFPESGKS